MEYSIVVIGAGGTGSFFLKELARFIDNSEKKDSIKVMVVDGDRVEKKNLKRQAYFADSIDCYKAQSMVSAINETFDVDFFYNNEYILESSQIAKCFDTLGNCQRCKTSIVPVIIGCVDNHRARQECEAYFRTQSDIIYYDAANEFSDGEIVYTTKGGGRQVGKLRSEYFPEVANKDVPNVVEISCSERNIVEPQHIVTNMMAANLLLIGITRLITEKVSYAGLTAFDAFKNYIEYIPMNEITSISEQV